VKFILGFIKGSKCPYDPSRPIVHVIVKSAYKGVEYRVERFKQDKDTGIRLPQLRVYDSDDFPPQVLEAWQKDGLILECLVSGDNYAGLALAGI